LTGTWGETVNNSITSLLDTAVAGTTTLSSDADVTLTTTTLASNQARQAIILWTAGGTATRTITAPASSKTYIVINKTSSTQSIKLVGAGPTTGITIVAGESVQAAWNGVDFIRIASTSAVSSFSAGTTGFTPSTATTGAITLSGTLGVTNGGTGLATLVAGYIPYGAGTSPYASSVNFSYNGSTLRVGNQALLGGATNPIVGVTGSANGFIQSYIYNASNSVNSSADFVAYPNNGSDSSGFVDMGITSLTFADALYSVTGPNESYVFASGPSGSSTSGNLVYATDSTGTTNYHQFYAGGFNLAKTAWKMQIGPAVSFQASILEGATITASAPASTTNFDVITQAVQFYTTNAANNFTFNIRGNSGTTLNATMATGQAVTIALLVTNGATAYYPTAIQIDGSSVTPKWQGGTAPAAGFANSVDVYNFVVIKTASATYTVLASQSQFA
jgi:hypothetical protein